MPHTPTPDPNSEPENSDPGQNPQPSPSNPSTPSITPPPMAPSEHSNDAPNLAEAITMLANSLSNSKKSMPRTKVRDPDPFDGSDPKKLQSFLVQCGLNFRDRPDAFDSNSAKVTYVLSYLTGTALDWFEPALSSDDEPTWLDDYPYFISKLKDNFGPHDPVGEAEANLKNLRMRDNQRVTKYVVEFNRLATRIEWGDAALRRQFYNGLPSRIKDKIARLGKPNSLLQLRLLTQSIDARYWERHSEVARETSTSKARDRPKDRGKSPHISNP